jgi:hypothetical protein
MTVSKNWWELDIDSKEEDKIYPLTLTEIADAQRKDQELKVCFKKNTKCHKRT